MSRAFMKEVLTSCPDFSGQPLKPLILLPLEPLLGASIYEFRTLLQENLSLHCGKKAIYDRGGGY